MHLLGNGPSAQLVFSKNFTGFEVTFPIRCEFAFHRQVMGLTNAAADVTRYINIKLGRKIIL